VTASNSFICVTRTKRGQLCICIFLFVSSPRAPLFISFFVGAVSDDYFFPPEDGLAEVRVSKNHRL
jgi:hypothetical protein